MAEKTADETKSNSAGETKSNGSVPRVVLVTGASRFLGGYLVRRLAQNPDIERVIAVDSVSPSKDMLRRMGRAEFVRADIRNPLIGKVVRGAEVDTVVHASTLQRAPKSGSRAAMKDMNVIGAMQLFAVCQKAPTVRKVVLRSASVVYGCSAKDPVKFTEEMSARRRPPGGYARDSLEIEGYLRGMGRRRPDISVGILRLAPLIGPQLTATVGHYVSAPVVPTIVGRDARLQLLHVEDALAALECATVSSVAGTYNIAADGVVMMSQAIRRAGRIQVPMPLALFRSAGSALVGSSMRLYTDEQLEYFRFGCGLDTTRMRTEMGFSPRWTTMQALDDFVRATQTRRIIGSSWIDRAEQTLTAIVGGNAVSSPGSQNADVLSMPDTGSGVVER
ncbi:NAD-dependent epimerase/dehydratase family protein [Rhodococcus sp. IEGM 1379]|uniref:NAD-dependent epimerase/dehydratase family protein n=1 Tax=Rhodococcus sp. IEGM 1379 TaxID=3047086 RepID=UPI0024B853A6|nr:NAD-dependent epimerase/dehydratase family protein [Rhodococcus sp. IEGM 1379]MDI9919182.1 NAD-dependent epimerase/dehydratase family protein [Rhodococcus sp. IEGM 1379]